MSTDTKTLSKPVVSDLVLRVASHLRHLPKSQRADALVHAVTQLILNRNPINFW